MKPLSYFALIRCDRLRYRLFSTLMLVCLSAPLSLAGIVEMPTIVEAPSLHGTSVFENYNIPSTANRNRDPDSGPRLWVKEIRVQGIDNFQGLNIRREEITAFVEHRRYAIMREDEIKAHGFTEKEVAEVMNLLNELEVETNYAHVNTAELQRFIWLVRQQKERRGLSFTQIDELAEAVENYYHNHGLKLAIAHVPRQTMRDGVLIINVINGTLGSVDVKQNTLYSDEQITGLFNDVINQPVTFERIEERMYLLNDLPGHRTSGLFLPGNQVGDSSLQLTVRHESRLDSTFRLDNHGTDLTGRLRGFAQFNINNPLGIADQIDLAVLQASSPSNSTYGLLGYRLPLFSPRVHLSLSASSNQFILDQSQDASGSVNQLGITGTTEQAGASLEYTYQRSRDTSIWINARYDTTTTQLDSDEFGNLGLDDKTRNLRLATRFDVLNSDEKKLHLGSIRLTQGEFVFGASNGRDEQYNMLNADYTLMSFVPLPWFKTNTRLLIKSELQYSRDALPAAEQNPIATPVTVRAYPVNQFSADSSLYLGLEWVFNTPELFKSNALRLRNIQQKIQPLFFINASAGVQNALNNADDINATLIGAGFGFQYRFGKGIFGNLQFAFPLKDKFSIDTIRTSDDTVRLVFDLQYRM